MTILVTGASGFLGRHVLARLADHSLRLLVLPDDPALPELQKQASVVAGDVTHPESLRPALEGVTQVVHLAGRVDGGRGPTTAFMEVNARGTANLARTAAEAGVVHFIYPSSITVYGYVYDADESAPLVRTPGYPASKIEAEWNLRQIVPAQATVLRMPLLLGAGDTGFLCPMLQGFRQAGRVVIVGSGQAPWTVLAAADAAEAIALCLAKPATRGRTYNVVGETVTNGKLLRAIGAGANCTRETHLPYAVAWASAALAGIAGRVRLTRTQVQALSRPLSMHGDRFARLGFVARTGWREALDQGIAWCRKKERAAK
jgi:nucleoside-diphosphate-sugar epimerase